MKLAIIGSRSIGDFPLEEYLPSGIEEIVSGGAKGIDQFKKLGKHVRIVMISSQKEKKESPS